MRTREAARTRDRSAAALSTLFALFAALFSGCSPAGGGAAAAVAEYADARIVIAGLKEEEFAVTPGELAELECVSRSASGKTAKAGSVSATGPTLAVFLEQYGYEQGDFALVRFLASDGYRVTIHERTLTGGEDIILAIASGDKPLSQTERPLRLLIPGLDSSQWIYAVERMEFESAD